MGKKRATKSEKVYLQITCSIEQDGHVRVHVRMPEATQNPASIEEYVQVITATDAVMQECKGLVADLYSYLIHEVAKAATQAGDLATSEGKQLLATHINHGLHAYHLAITHPETGRYCTLLAISDKKGGSFTLEGWETRKRSRSTRDILKLMPLHLMPDRRYANYLNSPHFELFRQALLR